MRGRAVSVAPEAFHGTFYAVGRSPTWFSPRFMPEERAVYYHDDAEKGHLFEVYNSFIDSNTENGFLSKVGWKAHALQVDDAHLEFRVESDAEEKFRDAMPRFLVEMFEQFMPESSRKKANFRIMYLELQKGKVQAMVVFGAKGDSRYHWVLVRAEKIAALVRDKVYDDYLRDLRSQVWFALHADGQITQFTTEGEIKHKMVWFNPPDNILGRLKEIAQDEAKRKHDMVRREAREADRNLKLQVAAINERRRSSAASRSSPRRSSSTPRSSLALVGGTEGYGTEGYGTSGYGDDDEYPKIIMQDGDKAEDDVEYAYRDAVSKMEDIVGETLAAAQDAVPMQEEDTTQEEGS